MANKMDEERSEQERQALLRGEPVPPPPWRAPAAGGRFVQARRLAQAAKAFAAPERTPVTKRELPIAVGPEEGTGAPRPPRPQYGAHSDTHFVGDFSPPMPMPTTSAGRKSATQTLAGLRATEADGLSAADHFDSVSRSGTGGASRAGAERFRFSHNERVRATNAYERDLVANKVIPASDTLGTEAFDDQMRAFEVSMLRQGLSPTDASKFAEASDVTFSVEGYDTKGGPLGKRQVGSSRSPAELAQMEAKINAEGFPDLRPSDAASPTSRVAAMVPDAPIDQESVVKAGAQGFVNGFTGGMANQMGPSVLGAFVEVAEAAEENLSAPTSGPIHSSELEARMDRFPELRGVEVPTGNAARFPELVQTDPAAQGGAEQETSTTGLDPYGR